MDKSHFKTALGQALYQYGHGSDRNNHRRPCDSKISSTKLLETDPALRERRFRAIHQLWSAILSEGSHVSLKKATGESRKAEITSAMLANGERAIEMVKNLLEPHQKLIVEEAENQEHSPTEMRLVLVGQPWKKSEETMWWMTSLLRIAAEWGIGEKFVKEGLLAGSEKRWDEAYEVLAIFREVLKEWNGETCRWA